MKKRPLITLLLVFLNYLGLAYHIVGGEITYNYLGFGKYEFVLKIYRDCGAGVNTDFDGNGSVPAYITVYDTANNLEGLHDIGTPLVTEVPPAFYNPCIQTPNTTCVEEGVYTFTLDLPPKAGGYTVIYQRCCRNSSVENLLIPDSQGSTYYTKIPGPEEVPVNSAPRFTKFPPIYICNKVNFKFDHSALDPDNDQLVYSLCAPFAGLDNCCPSILSNPSSAGGLCISPPPSCPQAASTPPYTSVLFASPYSGSYPIPGNPAFSINPVTGELSGTPTLIGQYVVGVCVQEFRNNKLINNHFRDFQFTVLNCTVNAKSIIADQEKQCLGQTIVFNNKSINNSSTPAYHWDFGVSNLSTDTSNIFNPTYLYPDTGIYMVTLITNPGKTCTDTLKKQVYVYPPLTINYKHPARQCFKNNSFSFKAEGIYLPQTTYRWDFSTNAIPATSTLKDPVGIHFTKGGLFYVKLKATQFACRDSFMDTVRIIGRPLAKINNLQSGLCEPALIGFSNGSSSDLPLSYFWNFGNGNTSSAFEPTHIFTPAGTYAATLTVETKELCKDTSIAILSNILVHPKPKSSFTVTPKEASIFEPDIFVRSFPGDNVISTFFDFGDGESSKLIQNLHTYKAYGNYKITQQVINGFGCVDSSSDVVKILPEFRFWIPNSFTPDNDNRNDFFMPVTIGISQYKFQIFNSWGQEIFKTNKIEEGWNGSYKGLECQQGIYVWKISFKNLVTEETETRLGHLTLLRNP